MENNEVNTVVTQQSTETGETVQNTPSDNQPTEQSGSKVQNQHATQADRTFTRDEVTKILQKRLDRYQKSVYTKYGVKDSTELDSLFEKAKSYDDIIRDRDEALEKVAFMGNNIDPDRYDDIKTYFKGKGLQFTEDALKQHLETHPEWVKKVETVKNNKPVTTITTVGTGSQGPANRSEQDLAKKIFGDDLFD